MTTQEIVDTILRHITELGFLPYKVNYQDTYVENFAVLSFRLRGLGKHWLFGMWIDTTCKDKNFPDDDDNDCYNKVYIFTQYDTTICKFTPTYSSLNICYPMQVIEHPEVSLQPFLELDEMLHMIQVHPLMCYAGVCGEYVGYYGNSFLWEFVSNESKHYWSQFKRKFYTCIFVSWTKLKYIFAKRAACIHSLEIYDYAKENPGWKTDFAHEVRIVFAEDATQDEELSWLYRWFRKEKYGEYDNGRCVIKVAPLKKVGTDREYVYV